MPNYQNPQGYYPPQPPPPQGGYYPPQQTQYVPAGAPGFYPPIARHKTDRSAFVYILLTIVTFGIYDLVVMSQITDEIDTVCSKHDGKKTVNYILMVLLLRPITLGIYTLVWYHQFCNRIGDELVRRNINYSFNASTYWLWCILGCFIFVGPFIFIAKYFKAINLLNESYNMYG